jgi:hypothetical protein
MPPPVQQPVKPAAVQPAAQASLQPAAIAAASTAQPQATQTAQAPQALGRNDAGRRAMGSTDTGAAKDSLASAIHDAGNATAAGRPRPRGSLLDVSV